MLEKFKDALYYGLIIAIGLVLGYFLITIFSAVMSFLMPLLIIIIGAAIIYAVARKFIWK